LGIEGSDGLLGGEIINGLLVVDEILGAVEGKDGNLKGFFVIVVVIGKDGGVDTRGGILLLNDLLGNLLGLIGVLLGLSLGLIGVLLGLGLGLFSILLGLFSVLLGLIGVLLVSDIGKRRGDGVGVLREGDDFGDNIGVTIGLNGGLATALALGRNGIGRDGRNGIGRLGFGRNGIGRVGRNGIGRNCVGRLVGLFGTRLSSSGRFAVLYEFFDNITQLLVDVLVVIKETLNERLLVVDRSENLKSEEKGVSVEGGATVIGGRDLLVIRIDEIETELDELGELGGETRRTLLFVLDKVLDDGGRDRNGHVNCWDWLGKI
jgi:hypothetical protein